MCMCGTGSSILLGFVNAREVGVSSRNLVSRTFPQIFKSMLTPMKECRLRGLKMKLKVKIENGHCE